MIRYAVGLLLSLLALAAPVAAQSTSDGSQPGQTGFGTVVEIVGNQVLVAEPNDMRSPGAVYV